MRPDVVVTRVIHPHRGSSHHEGREMLRAVLASQGWKVVLEGPPPAGVPIGRVIGTASER